MPPSASGLQTPTLVPFLAMDLPCSTKSAYPDEASAQHALRLTQGHKEGVVMMPTRAYYCEFEGCGKWHLTSKPSKRFIGPILAALGLENT